MRTTIGLAAVVSISVLLPAEATNPPHATVAVQCAGKPGSQVALKWSGDTMKQFTVKCGASGTLSPPQSPPLPIVLQTRKSTIEVQTEGGLETSYVIDVTVDSQKPPLNNILHLQHYGSPTVTTDERGYTMTRSAGPDKYGEQNFRIQLGDAKPVPVTIVAESSGDRSSAQSALRWGHPDYDGKSYFATWTVKPGPSQQKSFSLTDPKSEFEIQTEGGEGTGYKLSMYVGKSPGNGVTPSISIVHNKPSTDDYIGSTDITFKVPNGSVYGEMSISVDAPWVTEAPPALPPSGWFGTVKVCNYAGTATLHLEGNLVAPGSSTATGAATMMGANAENDPVTFSLQAAGVSVGTFKTKQNFYEQGIWQITAAQVMGVTGRFPGQPKAQLPGGIGNPVLDFTGGNCLTR